MAGKDGIEESMDAVLTGQAGWNLVRVDASGFRFRHEEGVDPAQRRREPRAGLDVVLTLDSRIQHLAEEALEGERGAVVMLDPRNGEVLAMASRPAYNPNRFSVGLSGKEWRRLRGAKGNPLFNRAHKGSFPPGSIFKPLVAIAALENRRANASTTFPCDGGFSLGNVRFRCWRRSGHGRIAMRKSIEQSCNAYYCLLGLRCGYDRIYHTAEALGFGQRTGIELRGESRGILPNEAWERRRNPRERWGKGDTCNVSIGQGYLTVTPLQMAVFASAIANGGTVYRPRLVRSVGVKAARPGAGLADDGAALVSGMPTEPSEVVQRMPWRPDTLAVVRGGMEDVIQVNTGTGKRARIEAVSMAGKTGTAEYGPRDARKKHAWMIVYAPADAPRYAMAIVIQDGVSGGSTAAPRVRHIMEGVFELEAKDRSG
jgi:penicillin-binding protein 2